MKHLKLFNESVAESTKGQVPPNKTQKRSARLLNDKQINYQGNPGTTDTIIFTDVVSSSKLWSDDPNTMKQQLDKHFNIIDAISKKWGGFVVKTIGDAFMIHFNGDKSLLKAINCSIEIIQKESLNLRVGVCCGPMELKNYTLQNAKLKDFFGNSVNVASRMESKIAQPGGVAITWLSKIKQDQFDQIKSLISKYNPKKVSISQIDLKGAAAKFAYSIKVK